MNLDIANLTNTRFDESFLKKVAKKTLSLLKLKFPELSVVLVCDARMRSLNRKYGKKDRITDVLSFDYGEIIICLPQAKRQAKELENSLKDELATLLIHGILHLAGFEDRTKKDCDKMFKIQKELWQKVTSSSV